MNSEPRPRKIQIKAPISVTAEIGAFCEKITGTVGREMPLTRPTAVPGYMTIARRVVRLSTTDRNLSCPLKEPSAHSEPPKSETRPMTTKRRKYHWLFLPRTRKDHPCRRAGDAAHPPDDRAGVYDNRTQGRAVINDERKWNTVNIHTAHGKCTFGSVCSSIVQGKAVVFRTVQIKAGNCPILTAAAQCCRVGFLCIPIRRHKAPGI